MAAHRKDTTKRDERFRALYAEGIGRNEMAKKMRLGQATVTGISHRLGLPFDRSATKDATQARQADCAALRANLAYETLQIAQRQVRMIEAPHTYIDHGGKDYIRVTWEQEQPTPGDKRNLMLTYRGLAETSLRLELHDAGQQDLPAVDAWLAALTAGGTNES